jgi:spore coat polysaccharide biosynthesis predicted glycosyltransferase SpsG
MRNGAGGRLPIVFVVRASVHDGLGHLVRSLCVLRELKTKAPVHLLLLGDGSGAHLIEEARITCTHCTSDIHAARLVSKAQPQVVVFDLLRFDARAFAVVAAAATTVSLSPTFSQMASVDHLFHRTAVADPAWAAEPEFPTIHKGFRYTVLPPWLKRVTTGQYTEQLWEERLAIAISMGGTDAPNRTLSLLDMLGRTTSNLVVWVALGDAYTHSYADLLHCASKNRQEIILLKSNDSMWRVLRNVSLVLCAGGLTTYEAAYMGLPTINLFQKPAWKFLFEELVARSACWTIPPSPKSFQHALRMVTALERDRKRLLSTHLATKNLIPSGGAGRVARKLQEIGARRTR